MQPRPAPALDENTLEIARSQYQAMYPDEPPPDAATLARAWHEWSHSPAMARLQRPLAERPIGEDYAPRPRR